MFKLSSRTYTLILIDAFLIVLAFSLARLVWVGETTVTCCQHPIFWVLLVVSILCLYVFDLYYPFKYFKPGQTFIDIFYAVSCSGILLAAFSYLNKNAATNRPVFLLSLLFFTAMSYFARMGYDFFLKTKLLDKRALIIGTGPLAYETAEIILRTPHAGIEIAGFVTDQEVLPVSEVKGIPIVGHLSRLLSLISWKNADFVILALEAEQKISETDLMRILMKQSVAVISAIHLCEKLAEAIPYQVINEHYILGLISEVRKRNYLKIKRLQDIFFSLMLLLITSPVCLFATLILFVFGPDKIFYKQKRIGRRGEIFELLKFRSMIHGKNGQPRVTRFGRWLRKYRIDEIPQLLNVLKGDMGLIGPRPEISYFVEKCREQIPFYDAVFTIRPGLTGWAQVKFLHVTDLRDYPRKFQYNLFYLKNLSLTLDILILFKTIRIILLGKGK